jgi:hypothetical protein
MSFKNEYAGSTPIPTIYTASNIKDTDGMSQAEVMRENYKSRLAKIMFDFNLKGQSAGGGNYVYPDYSLGAKKTPGYVKYNTYDSVYKNYGITPCFL